MLLVPDKGTAYKIIVALKVFVKGRRHEEVRICFCCFVLS